MHVSTNTNAKLNPNERKMVYVIKYHVVKKWEKARTAPVYQIP